MDFVIVHPIRWRLSDQVILGEILAHFESATQAVIREFEQQQQQQQQIAADSAVGVGVKALRFLLSDGECHDEYWTGKPARLKLIRAGFIPDLVRVLALDDGAGSSGSSSSSGTSSSTIPLKENYLKILVELTKDEESMPELRVPALVRSLLKILGLSISRYQRMRQYAQLAICQIEDEKILQVCLGWCGVIGTLDDSISATTHMLTAAVEKKIQGKFVFHSLQHVLQLILKLSASNANKERFAGQIRSLMFILNEPYEPLAELIADELRRTPSEDDLHTAARSGLPKHVLMVAKFNTAVLTRRIRTLLSPEVKRLAAETLLSLVFSDANALSITLNKVLACSIVNRISVICLLDWIAQLRRLLTDADHKYMKREIQGIFLRLSFKNEAFKNEGFNSPS
eukprot:g2776.t1